jgi:hypothetical protein
LRRRFLRGNSAGWWRSTSALKRPKWVLSIIGVIGPTAFYADTRARATADGSNFTGGKVRLIVYFLETTAPTA